MQTYTDLNFKSLLFIHRSYLEIYISGKKKHLYNNNLKNVHIFSGSASVPTFRDKGPISFESVHLELQKYYKIVGWILHKTASQLLLPWFLKANV